RKHIPDHAAARFAPLLGYVGLILYLALAYWDGSAQTLPKEIDPNNSHCSVMQGTPDNQTIACQVWDRSPERFAAPLQIEIYRQGRKMATIEAGEPILEWHFWKDGKQLAIHFGRQDGSGGYALYDTVTAIQVGEAPASLAPNRLPQWAKSQAQISDESVRESAELTQQRNTWMAKVMRQLNSIHPGMTRKELAAILTTEGGLSTRFQRTYVSRECPYIKLDLHFKAGDGDTATSTEEPEDIVESVSGPYLGWSIMD
ncbi:MAG TPA: hypothetical protein VGG59_05135, partial [Acidobacteriaceae bacterium]